MHGNQVSNMKNLNIIIAGLCAAALLSCNKENPTEDTSRRPMTFSVVSEDTKAHLEDNVHVRFKVGDAISVFDGTANNMFTAQTVGDKTTFSGEAVVGKDSYLIVSPYSASNSMINESVAQYEIPDVQVATPGTFDPDAFVSVGRVLKGNKSDVTLYSAVSLVKVTVPSGLTVKEIQLASGGPDPVSQAVAGTFQMNAENVTPPTLVVGTGRYVISLVPESGKTTIAPGTYYIVVRPREGNSNYYPGLTLAFVGDSYVLYKRSNVKQTQIPRHYILNLGSLDEANFTPVSAGTAVLKPGNGSDNATFSASIKRLLNSSAERDTDDNTITKIVFKAHTLTPSSTVASVVSTDESTSAIRAVRYGSTVCVYTEAPTLTLSASSYDLFFNFRKLESVEFNKVTSKSGSVNFTSMFHGCTSLKTVDMGYADFSNVLNMTTLFNNCGHVESIDFGNMTTTVNTKMPYMFLNEYYLKTLKLGPDFVLGNERTNMFSGTSLEVSKAGNKCSIFLKESVYKQLTDNAVNYLDPTTQFHKLRFTPTYL